MEGLYFEDAFIIFLVSGFEFPPAMDVHGVLELILESLDFGFLVEEFFFFEADF